MSAPTRGATGDYSKGPSRFRGALNTLAPLAIGLFAAAVLGGILLIAAEFSVVNRITTGDNIALRTFRGYDRHYFALAIVAALALPLAWGGFIGRSRHAFAGLALLGLAALLIVLIVDTPQLNDARGFDVRFEGVHTHVGVGYYLETAGSILILAAGACSWFFTAGAIRIRRPRSTETPETEPEPSAD